MPADATEDTLLEQLASGKRVTGTFHVTSGSDALMDRDFDAITFHKCTVIGGDFCSSIFRRCVFDGVLFKNAALVGVTFDGCRFLRCKFLDVQGKCHHIKVTFLL